MYNTPTTTLSLFSGYMSALFGDLLPVFVLAIGIPAFFYLLSKIITGEAPDEPEYIYLDDADDKFED